MWTNEWTNGPNESKQTSQGLLTVDWVRVDEDTVCGPPYALLQGGLRPGPPAGALEDNAADAAAERRYPVMRRGMVAWAGGGLGPDFFIALGEGMSHAMPCHSHHTCARAYLFIHS